MAHDRREVAYFDGRIIPAHEAAVSVTDAGFLLGVTVAEQLRTFGGKLFRPEAHLDRLSQSLKIAGFDSPIAMDELARVAREIAEKNYGLLAPGDDLGLTIFVTPGPAASLAPGAEAQPLVCVHTRPLPFGQWAARYTQGESLATTEVLQVSDRSWPRALKCRSRMHYFLADRAARAAFPGARAVMMDEDGHVTEATTANLLIFRNGQGLATPPKRVVLPGISLDVVFDLAGELQIPLVEQNLGPRDLALATEVLLCSTSPCLLPVTRFNGNPIGSGVPGEVFGRLLAAWSKLVGVDIPAQAAALAARG